MYVRSSFFGIYRAARVNLTDTEQTLMGQKDLGMH